MGKPFERDLGKKILNFSTNKLFSMYKSQTEGDRRDRLVRRQERGCRRGNS